MNPVTAPSASRLDANASEPPDPSVAPPRPARDRGSHDSRLDFLFRQWLREGHVHPLIHLVRRYRAGERQ